MALVGYWMSSLWAKLETKSVTPDTAFHFNSKDVGVPGLSWSFILHQDLCSHVSTMQRAPSVQFPIQCKKHHQFIHHLLSNPYH
jgi:hypothetical protein